jgi:ferredoxin-NADP reductase
MTSLHLLLWIAGAILIQLAIYLGIGFWRHWQTFDALRLSAIEGGIAIPSITQTAAETQPIAAAWTGMRTFKVTDKLIENEANDICSFHLAPQDGQSLLPFLPGQYLTFKLDIPLADGSTESVTRCYSLSDAPRSNGYRVSIKRAPAPPNSAHPAGRSSNYFHDQVQVGSLLQVRAPSGHFHIDRSKEPVVLIAGGIGITPLLSMITWSLTEQTDREVWLFYGVRHRHELMASLGLRKLAAAHPNFHLQICFSDPLTDDVLGQDFQHHGRVNVGLLRRQLPLKPYHFYICGPKPMLESLVPALEDWGVRDSQIHFEAFGPASVIRRSTASQTSIASPALPSGKTLTINFAKSGKQLPWQPGDGNLLDFAEAHGIVVNSGCRAGGCGSCQTTIAQGEVHYQQAPDFDPEPGTCLMCVATPQTHVTLAL